MHANDTLIARETDLPALGLLLDPVRLAEVIGAGPLVLDYLRLKHGTSCTAAYRIGETWLVAKAVTADRLDELKPGTGLQGLPHMVLPDLFLQIAPAAKDKHMRGLADALDPNGAADLLATLRREAGIRADQLVPLKLKPQRRLVARLDHKGQAVALLKVYSRDRFADALVAATLSQQVSGAKLLYANARRGVIVTEWLQAAPLNPASATEAQMAETGRLLAKVHDSDVPMPMRLTRDDQLRALEGVLQDCASLLPLLAPRLGALWQRLRDALLGQPGMPGLLHGDFSADQVLIGEGQPHLIDWDRSAIGDRGSDLGCALARMDKDVLDGGLSRDRADVVGRALLGGYGDAAALPPSMGAQRLCHLALLLTEDFRAQRQDWHQRIERLLSHIEAQLPVLPFASLDHPDPALPGLADALDPAMMGPLLKGAGFTLVAPPQLIRHKKGRRAMIRYETERGLLLGKMRRKGLDRRTVDLQQSLRAAGLDGTPPLHVEVPEVLLTSEQFGLWVMPGLGGEMLDPQVHDKDAFFRTGRALAQLHLSAVKVRRGWSLTDEAEVLKRALQSAKVARPGQAGRLQAVHDAAVASLTALPAGETVLLHRDFYQDQVMVQPDRIVLLDLDLAAHGDAAIDIGNFVAHLQELGLRRAGDTDAYSAEADAFLAGYGALGRMPDPERMRAMTDLSLARHLDICLRFPEREGYFAELLALLLVRYRLHAGVAP